MTSNDLWHRNRNPGRPHSAASGAHCYIGSLQWCCKWGTHLSRGVARTHLISLIEAWLIVHESVKTSCPLNILGGQKMNGNTWHHWGHVFPIRRRLSWHRLIVSGLFCTPPHTSCTWSSTLYWRTSSSAASAHQMELSLWLRLLFTLGLKCTRNNLH